MYMCIEQLLTFLGHPIIPKFALSSPPATSSSSSTPSSRTDSDAPPNTVRSTTESQNTSMPLNPKIQESQSSSGIRISTISISTG